MRVMKRSIHFLAGQEASKDGRSHYWDNPHPDGSKEALAWFDGFMDAENARRIHLAFCYKPVERAMDTWGLLTRAHYVGIANYDGNIVRVFDLKIQQRPHTRVTKAEKLVTTVQFWDVGGGKQGSGTAETCPGTDNAHFFSAIAAMRVAGVMANLKACEGIDNEEALFKRLFPAVGDLIRVPDRVYNFEVFKVV